MSLYFRIQLQIIAKEIHELLQNKKRDSKHIRQTSEDTNTEQNICISVDCNFRLKQRIMESRLWPVEIMRSLAPLAKVPVRQLCYQIIGSEMFQSP